jgi:hypothetical protein
VKPFRIAPEPARGLAMNTRELVMITVMGEVAPPLEKAGPYRVGNDGRLRVLPGTGGIVLSHRVGDPCVGVAGDHIEPAVSIRSEQRSGGSADAANQALQTFACVGNFARVMSGRAIEKVGVVTGKHGGIDNILIDFPLAVMKRMSIGDKVQVYAYGVGLRLTEHPDIAIWNCSPRLIGRWGLHMDHGRIRAPVTHTVPARIMGSGLGRNNTVKGDYDIQMSDPAATRRHRLGTLRFGDLVAITDADNRFGRSHREGFVTLGVIIHSESTVSGHGPGVVTLLSGPAERFALVRDPAANIANYLNIRPARTPRDGLWLPTREAAERRRAQHRIVQPVGGLP